MNFHNSIALAFQLFAKFQFKKCENYETKHMTTNATDTAHVKYLSKKYSLKSTLFLNIHIFGSNNTQISTLFLPFSSF